MLYRTEVLPTSFSRKEVRDQEDVWRKDGYEPLLRRMFPEGIVESGCFRVSSSGDSGRRMSFILENGKWTDFSEEIVRNGLLSFIYEIEGWSGIQNFTRRVNIPFDFVIMDGKPPPLDFCSRLAIKIDRLLAGRWDYVDDDGFYLGSRLRFEDKKGAKEFRLLSNRTRMVKNANGKIVERQEGWRIDGTWVGGDPLYIEPGFTSRDKPVLICEGEKATDAARKLLGEEYDCITWGSGSAGSARKAMWKFVGSRKVFCWPDKDEPGRKASSTLSKFIKDLRVAQVWTEETLKTGDDLADVDADKIDWVRQLLLDAPIGGSAGSGQLRDDWVYAVVPERFINIKQNFELTVSAFRRAHMRLGMIADEEMLNDGQTQQVQDVTYFPGQPVIVTEIDPENGTSGEYYNMWRDTGVEAINGEPEVFLKHLESLIPEAYIRDELLDYLAFITQNPAKKTTFCPLIIGPQGIGKSYLLRVMSAVLGQTNVKEITTQDLSSDFNKWMTNSQLIVVEEIFGAGKREITNKMKTLISSPTVQVNAKNKNLREIENRANFLLFSNERVPLIIDPDDRRFFIYRSQMEAQPASYYSDLFSDLEDKGGSYIRRYLENRDISHFSPNKVALMTPSKLEMIKANESPIEAVMKLAIEAKRSIFSMNQVTLFDIVEWCTSQKGVRMADVTVDAVRNLLDKLGCAQSPPLEGAEAYFVREVPNPEAQATQAQIF